MLVYIAVERFLFIEFAGGVIMLFDFQRRISSTYHSIIIAFLSLGGVAFGNVRLAYATDLAHLTNRSTSRTNLSWRRPCTTHYYSVPLL